MFTSSSLTLTEGVRAPAHARAWLAAQQSPLSGDTADDALLIVSELVTNAVRHGAPDVVLSIKYRRDRLRIEVADGGAELPFVPDGRPAADRATGRGLLIVSATALDWGVTRFEGGPGKVVWAELALPEPA